MKNIEQLPHDPPLRAVRAFEAFARLGSVTAAAGELDITPSAVSHQLQLLEAFIQTPLTVREGRLLALTDEGRDYYRSISAAFSVLRSATRFVRDRSSLRQITVSLIPLLVVLFVSFGFHDSLGTSALIIALSGGVIATYLLNRRYFRNFGNAVSEGTLGAIVAIANTAAVVGFGGVVKTTPAFATAVDAITSIPGSPLIGGAVAVGIIAYLALAFVFHPVVIGVPVIGV